MKRVFALMMALLFVVSLLPAAALAEGDFQVKWPSKTTYVQGESIGTVTATLDGSDATGFVTVTPSKFTETGDQVAVTATYQNGEEMYSDTTYVKVVAKGNYSISVTPPTKTEYPYNESLDPTGLVADLGWEEYDESTGNIVAGAGETINWPDSRLSVSPTSFTKEQIGETVTITLTYSDGGVTLTDTFDVTVKGIAATNVEIDGEDEQDVEVNGTLTLTATVDPSDASDEFEWYSGGEVTVTWDPSNSLTATVTGGDSEGSTNVGIRSKDKSSITDSIIVHVKAKEPEAPSVASVEIVAEDGSAISSLEMLEGTERKLSAVAKDSDGNPVAAAYVTWVIDSNDGAINASAFTADGTLTGQFINDPGVTEKKAKVHAEVDGVSSSAVEITVKKAATDDKKYTFIRISGGPTTTQYMVGNKFDPKGLEVRAFVQNESVGEALGDIIPDAKLKYTITRTEHPDKQYQVPNVADEKFISAGDATLTVYFTFKYTNPDKTTVEKTLSATKTIKVYSERPLKIVVDEAPYTSAYFEGEKLDTKGLRIKVAYTTANFGAASPEISRYVTLPNNTDTIPELNHKFTADDVANGYKQYELYYKDANGLEPVGPNDVLQVTVSAPATISGISPSKLEFAYEDIEAQTEMTFTVTVPALATEEQAKLLESALSWSISNSKVASYTKEFDWSAGTFTVTVKALQPGNTTISVRPRGAGEETGVSCAIVVNGKPDETIYAMQLNHKKLTLLLGETGALIPVFVPETGYDEVTWEATASGSYDPYEYIDQTKLEKEGLIKTLKITPADMTLTITATTVHNHPTDADAPLTASAEVVVTGISVDSMTIDTTSIELFAGSEALVSATVYPAEATDKTVAWTSSDNTSAEGYTLNGSNVSVSEKPIVTVVSVYQEGSRSTGRIMTDRERLAAYLATKGKTSYTATIYAIASSGITKSCKVTVRMGTLIDTITLNKHSLVLSANEQVQLTATIKPSNASNKTLKWTSSDPSVATVDEAGIVTGKGPGKTIITCEATDGSGASDTCAVQISLVLIQSITVDPYTVSIMENETAQLTARLYPANVTSTKVTWSSSNTDVATVDANGKVTGQGGGEAIIKATSADGGSVYGTAIVKVKAAVNVTSVKINPGSFELLLNDSTTLTVTASPKGAEDMARAWSTSDKSVVSIDSKGKVTGLKLGTATITVKVGKKTDSITIRVVSALSRYGEVVNCKKRVNVRASASGTSKSLGYAYLGDDYKVLGQTGNWVKIQYTKSKVGYIWYTYIDIVNGSTPYVSNGTSTNAGSAADANTTYTQVTIVNVKEWCNVRSGPGTGFSKVGTAPLHAVYTFRGVQGDWIQVLYGNTTAFIYKDYCQLS